MSQYSKNEIYKKVFNKFCEYHNEENKYPSQSLEEIIKLLNKIENELNLVKNKIYYNTEYDSSKNLIEKNIINTVRKETKENNLFNDRKLSTNKEEDNLMYRQEIFNKHIENLNSIQREISEILKDNFKSRDHDDKKDEYELSRANSEAVLVDKDELTDFTKKSPIIHLNMEQQLTIKEEKLISTKNLSHQELSELIETKYKNILSDLKKINEYTKLPDNSSKNYYIIQFLNNHSKFRHFEYLSY